MVVGSTINVVRAEFMLMVNINTPTLRWAAPMVVTGIGTGLGVNLPYTAVHVALRYNQFQLPEGSSRFATNLV
jgi:hypothetical protein